MEMLRSILNFTWAQDLSMSTVKFCFLTFFMLILIFALYQRRDYVYQGAPDQARWRDLRIWAALILIAQSTLYLIF